MEFFKKLDVKPLKVVKIVVLFIVALIVIAIGLSFTATSMRSMVSNGNVFTMAQAPMNYGTVSYRGASGIAFESKGADMASLSIRNIAPTITMGDTAEAYEVTDYNGSIETGDLAGTCGVVVGLKAKDYVVFENANMYEHGCNYSFKVEKSHVEEILASIKALNPRELSENTQTIKNQVDDFTSEISILQKKAQTIDETLKSATRAYDDITGMAIQTRDATALAKIIDSKIQIIERLTQERISVSAQLDRLSRSKASQLDRLEYTYFNINVYENRFVDGKNIKDSWKAAVKDFVQTINKVAQGMTIGLLGLLFVIVQFALYILIILFLAKYGWKLVKHIWEK